MKISKCIAINYQNFKTIQYFDEFFITKNIKSKYLVPINCIPNLLPKLPPHVYVHTKHCKCSGQCAWIFYKMIALCKYSQAFIQRRNFLTNYFGRVNCAPGF